MKKDLVEDIKARLSVEEVVGSYLDLKRSGNSYKALSPFKTEKTPSLIVTPAKELWKDFSSGKGGDIFRFIMHYEGVDFKEALNILALKAGLNPDDYRNQRFASKKTQDTKKRILKVLDIATDFYEEQFKKSVRARQYVKNRRFQASVVKDFRIGYSPSDWQSLCRHFTSLKIRSNYADMAGLIKKRPIPQWLAKKEKTTATERWGDFFADRLMVPLSDPQGRIIGFTGRLLADKEGIAKYVNSKQTILYNKSKHVFGYFQAKDEIRQAGFALVVEGNLDVIACHQAGYKQTVAAGGTALTTDHLKIISRLTKDVRLAFDGDAAGTAAMERSLLAAQKVNVNLSIISLPEDCDPDDLIRKNLDLWQKAVQNYQPAPEWLYEKYKSKLDLKTAGGKKYLTDVMLPIIGFLKDEVEKDHYLQKLEEEVGISRNSLEKKMKVLSTQKVVLTQSIRPAPEQRTATYEQAEVVPFTTVFTKDDRLHLLLGLLLKEPQLRILEEDIANRLEIILDSYKIEKKLFQFLKASDVLVEDVKNLPKNLQTLRDCARLSLGILRKAEKGHNQTSDFDTRKQFFSDLFDQLDILQAKAERTNIV